VADAHIDRELRSCVAPDGRFLAGRHDPSYHVLNHRLDDEIMVLGHDQDGRPVDNEVNFPEGDLFFDHTDPVFEIPNAFPFWGTTYILGRVALQAAETGLRFSFLPKEEGSFGENGLVSALAAGQLRDENGRPADLSQLPRPLLLAIAQTCRDPEILAALCPLCCSMEFDEAGRPVGLRFRTGGSGRPCPDIRDRDLFETLGNNPALPDEYKRVMLLNPGVQGENPIMGEYFFKDQVHIWEYLRSNSYIPWGHFASNMAQDSIRYSAEELTLEDIKGLRHLYYQRIYSKLAVSLGMALYKRGLFTPDELDRLRARCLDEIRGRCREGTEIPFTATLWGWNYGYDFSPSGMRLHASHQQIHQQFALIPGRVEVVEGSSKGRMNTLPSYAVGDQVEAFLRRYLEVHGVEFFQAFFKAVESNRRLDGRRDRPESLVIFEDENVLLMVPKAQRSQGEVQVVAKGGVGNIVEADTGARASLDRAIFMAIKSLAAMGAKMVTCYEVSARFDREIDQALIYCFLPRHPHSPGAFSERQGRWITGHFPEDYAECFRKAAESQGLLA